MTNQSLASIAELLQQFHDIGHLGQKKLLQLAKRARVHLAPAGACLLELGSTEGSTLYLLEGEVELLARDGNKRKLAAGEPGALRALGRLRPSQYEINAVTDARFLKIDNEMLDELLKFDASRTVHLQEFSQSNGSTSWSSRQDALIAQIYTELQFGHITIPSLFDVAEKVGEQVLSLGGDSRQLSRVLMLDPALAVKTVAAANKMQRPEHCNVESCLQAVEQLGTKRATEMVVKWVLHDSLRQPSRIVAERMRDWWRRSLSVAAISKELARLNEEFDPDVAAFAGLVHRIGEPILLYYADRLPGQLDQLELDQFIADNASEVGRSTLKHWNLSNRLLAVVGNAGKLWRDHAHAADYSDIVLVAERHADIGQRRADDAPSPDKMPAFARLGLHEQPPELGLHLVATGKNASAQADLDLLLSS